MRDLALRALDTAQAGGVDYADARVVLARGQRIEAKNGAVAQFEESEDLGIGVRVLKDSGWGFAATNDLSPASIDACVGRARALARASARVATRPVRLAPIEPEHGFHCTPFDEEPLEVPAEEKIDLLVRTTEAMRIDPLITVALAAMRCSREEKYFASTEGARIEQTLLVTAFVMQAKCARGRRTSTASPSPAATRWSAASTPSRRPHASHRRRWLCSPRRRARPASAI
jgi:TldD protein